MLPSKPFFVGHCDEMHDVFAGGINIGEGCARLRTFVWSFSILIDCSFHAHVETGLEEKSINKQKSNEGDGRC